MKKKLLTESQMRRMAAIAGIPALGGIVGRISEKLDIQAEGEHKDEEEKMEETNEEVVVEEEEMEMDAEAEVEMEPEMEEPAGEEVSQDKIESLVDAVLAAIEAETGVPAERVDSAEEMPAEEPEMEMDAEEPEMEMDAEEAEEEMMETTTPSLAERIAQAVQAVIDEDAALEESNCSTNEEEEVDEGYKMDEDEEEDAEEDAEEAEAQLDEITKAVVARLRSLK
jgi:hypothetical protein